MALRTRNGMRVPSLAADASRRASLLVAYIRPVCALLAPRRAGASTPRFGTLIPFRVLTQSAMRSATIGCPVDLAPMIADNRRQYDKVAR